MRCFLGWVIWTKCWWYRRTFFMRVRVSTHMHSSIIMPTTWLIEPYRTYLDELARLCGEWYFSSDHMQYFSKLLNAVQRDSIAETLLTIFNSKSKLQSQTDIHYDPASFSGYMLVNTLPEKFLWLVTEILVVIFQWWSTLISATIRMSIISCQQYYPNEKSEGPHLCNEHCCSYPFQKNETSCWVIAIVMLAIATIEPKYFKYILSFSVKEEKHYHFK